jgi:hypothetical protein
MVGKLSALCNSSWTLFEKEEDCWKMPQTYITQEELSSELSLVDYKT